MEELKIFLAEQNLTDFIDDIEMLEAKCKSMDQHIQWLEEAVSSIRRDIAKRAMQGLMANPKYADIEADDIADIAVEQADVLLLKLKGLSAVTIESAEEEE
ncbi:hypothetical protein D0962_34895 [Leptolyngbyaceae cyanobacterium CCMR0082]|uniref:Uncharacterized protein n=1 Tax=Adonisia turfae CCMR0082 TaxID=2304604 RepID=A0A6M0SIS0_9CYAN|nr:hypothetical protein [Adonisia turfae]NEZ67883.1 hypothetical protein [Adonisia turfae CCMR0082]